MSDYLTIAKLSADALLDAEMVAALDSWCQSEMATDDELIAAWRQWHKRKRIYAQEQLAVESGWVELDDPIETDCRRIDAVAADTVSDHGVRPSPGSIAMAKHTVRALAATKGKLTEVIGTAGADLVLVYDKLRIVIDPEDANDRVAGAALEMNDR